jgi:hypothetical protein
MTEYDRHDGRRRTTREDCTYSGGRAVVVKVSLQITV